MRYKPSTQEQIHAAQALIAQLAERWPKAFFVFEQRRRPLKIGLVTNRPTLKLLIKRGLFPPPLKLSPRMLLWDVADIAALVERLRINRAA